MPIPVIYSNTRFLAVDKPIGLSVHNAENGSNLLDRLSTQLKLKELFPVHRLDKETSGVQVLALDAASARELAEEFQQGKTRKIYSGLLRGQLAELQGRWTDALSDKAEGRKNPQGLARDRVACETRFRRISSNRYFSHCEFDLITGRQHQIRKHCAIHRAALVGDERYGDPRYNRKIAELYGIRRMFLHCLRVEIAGQSLECALPLDWNRLCPPSPTVGS